MPELLKTHKELAQGPGPNCGCPNFGCPSCLGSLAQLHKDGSLTDDEFAEAKHIALYVVLSDDSPKKMPQATFLHLAAGQRECLTDCLNTRALPLVQLEEASPGLTADVYTFTILVEARLQRADDDVYNASTTTAAVADQMARMTEQTDGGAAAKPCRRRSRAAPEPAEVPGRPASAGQAAGCFSCPSDCSGWAMPAVRPRRPTQWLLDSCGMYRVRPRHCTRALVFRGL